MPLTAEELVSKFNEDLIQWLGGWAEDNGMGDELAEGAWNRFKLDEGGVRYELSLEPLPQDVSPGNIPVVALSVEVTEVDY